MAGRLSKTGGFLRKALLWLLRVYSYLFHLLLSLFLLGIALVVLIEGQHNLKLDMLPWAGAALTRAVLLLGLAGLLCLGLAILGKVRWLFPLWTLIALALMIRGFFLSGYSFSGESHFRLIVWATVGALLAVLGSLSLFGRKSRR
jgi:hypothetical protein